MSTDDGESNDPSPHVHLTVPVEKKRKWLEYAYENYRGNLSSLIETSVDKSISSAWMLEEDVDSVDSVDMTGVETELDNLQSQMTTVLNQMDQVTRDRREELSRREFMEVVRNVREILPKLPTPMDSLTDFDRLDDAEPEDRAKSGTVTDISTYLEVSERHARQACLYLEQEHTEIRSLVDDETRRWYIYPENMYDLPNGSANTMDQPHDPDAEVLYDDKR